MKKLLKISLIIALVLTMSLILTAQTKKDIIVTSEEGETESIDERVAIVVGVDGYVSIKPLEYAVADARLVKNTLEEYGMFTVKYFADDYEVKSRIPNRGNIMREIKNQADAVKRGWVKTLIVYFSGHGFEREGRKHYLATIDTHPKILEESSIDLSEVITIMNDARKKGKVMLFLDACRNNPKSKKRGVESETWSDIDSRGLAVLRSTSEGQFSYEFGDLGHGVYTYYLTKGMEGEADYDENGYVSYNELARYVWKEMGDWSDSNEHNLTQIPKSTIYEQYGDFYITTAGKFQPRPRIHPDLESVSYRDMVTVDGGTFTQTNAWNTDESFKHTVSSFEIGKYEVTYELWYTVYQWAIDNGYKFANAGMEGSETGGGDRPDYNNVGKRPTSSSKHEPVTVVNWRDTIVWCNAYSEMCNKSPVYLNSSGKVIKDSRNSNGDECDSAEPDWDADGYRLPTEGEWQFAASDRGDTPYDYASGARDSYSNSSATSEVAWYDDNACDGVGSDHRDYGTHDVGTKRANGLGLYDMSGNVWEWCWDWYDDLPTSSATDYRNSTAGSYRVERGGSWDYSAQSVRVGIRGYSSPYLEYNSLGFRLARRP